MNTSAEPELEERRNEDDYRQPKQIKIRPKIIEFQRNYDQSMMSTNDGNTASNINTATAIKFSPSVESVDKINEIALKVVKIDGVQESQEMDLGDDPTLIMKSRETSERCESISQSYRSESKVAVTSSQASVAAEDAPESPQLNDYVENQRVSVAQNFEVIRTSILPAPRIEMQNSSMSNGNQMIAPMRNSIQIQGSIIGRPSINFQQEIFQPAAQEVIFEAGDDIDMQPVPDNEQNGNRQQQQQQDQQEQQNLVLDNLPCIVKTHFDFQDMINDIFQTEFWFQKMLYPVTTVGILFCLVVTSSLLNEIDMDLHGEEFLNKILIQGETKFNKPYYALLHVNINFNIYYSQIVTNFLILVLIFVQCKPSGNQNRRILNRIRKLVVYSLTCISGLLNLCIIAELVLLKQYLHDEKIMELVSKVDLGDGFYHWYHLMEIIFDARCFFWFMLSFVLLFLIISVLLSQTVLVIFYAYERNQGRVYRNSPQLRFYRHNVLDSRTIRPEVEKFLEENKKVYELPEGYGEKDIEECMICLQEFCVKGAKNEDGSVIENDMVIVLKCGGTPDSATVPTPATVVTEGDRVYDTERGVFETDRGLVHNNQDSGSSNSRSKEGSEPDENSPTRKSQEAEVQIQKKQNKARHIFHYECLKEWLKKREVCPLCNSQVLSDNQQSLQAD